MTIIRIECPNCSDAYEIPVEALALDATDVDAPDGAPEGAPNVSWICGACATFVTRLISDHVLLLLVSEGAWLVDEGDAAVYPEARIPGAPFTADDLLELHEELEQDDLVAHLAPEADVGRDGSS